MKVKITRPAKTAMQSGKSNSKKWILVPLEENNSRWINKLTGWVSSNNTNTQLKIEFINKEEAIKYAEDQGFEYEIHEPQFSSLKSKSYASNFSN